MPCICCFFDNLHQKQMKYQCMGYDSFEERLYEYKRLFLEELVELSPISDCVCKVSQEYRKDSHFTEFTNQFLSDIRDHTAVLSDMFDLLLDIYKLSVNGKEKETLENAKKYTYTYCTNYSSKNAIQMTSPLFRARQVGTYDNSDIRQFFHLPLSRKTTANEQRFNAPGTIMLYLARSIPTALKETDLDISKANLSVFFPKYSSFYNKGMYSFQNSIDITLNEVLTSFPKFSYDNDRFTFSKKNMIRMMGDSILFQVLNFPAKGKNHPIDEYRLPQVFTSLYHSNPYCGVVYHSSKDISIFSGLTRYAELDSNYCFFVPDYDEDYNMDFLDCFHHVCIGECPPEADLNNVTTSMYQLIEKNKTQNSIYNMTDYIDFSCNVKRHISMMQKVLWEGTPYYCTETGKTELRLFYTLIAKVGIIVDSPSEYGVIKWTDM